MELQQVRAAVLVEQMYQEMELWYPVYRLREAGCRVTVVGPEAGQVYPSKLGYPARSDKAAREVRAEDFDVLVIAGGDASRGSAWSAAWPSKGRLSPPSVTAPGCCVRHGRSRAAKRPASSPSRTT